MGHREASGKVVTGGRAHCILPALKAACLQLLGFVCLWLWAALEPRAASLSVRACVDRGRRARGQFPGQLQTKPREMGSFSSKASSHCPSRVTGADLACPALDCEVPLSFQPPCVPSS